MSADKHHIVSFEVCLKIFISLLILTVVTVAVSRVDLGVFNFTVGMIIATTKALLVIFFFMALKYDTNENRAIFFSSIIFVVIFIGLTFSDLLFREPLESEKIDMPPIPLSIDMDSGAEESPNAQP